MDEVVAPIIDNLSPHLVLLTGLVALLLATQLVVIVLNRLESHRLSSVYLGTLVTPFCTGFPNLMIGLFGQERLQGDVVIQLNIGNNIANTSLVTGLLLLVGGALQVRPPKKRSKKYPDATRRLFFVAQAFLWLGFLALAWTAKDGLVDRIDALLLLGIYGLYHLHNLRARRKPTKKTRLSRALIIFIIVVLAFSAATIYLSIELIGSGLGSMGTQWLGPHLGLLLGLLTVIPESFLLLRLAIAKGNVGFSGLLGDCLVSIPLVIGLSAMIEPISTPAFDRLGDPALWPFLHLAITMAAFFWLSVKPSKPTRETGLLFIALYVMVWLNSSS